MRLTTERLLLREFREDDADGYAAMCADPDVMRYLSANGSTLSRDDAWRQMAMFAGHWALRGYGMWAVEERASGRFVGRVGLHCPEGWPDREIGWALCQSWWGQGFAYEAATAAAAWAFARFDWTHLVSLIHPANQRSIALARRLGAEPAGSVELRGVTQDVYRLARPV
jgi:RimJ/RimL family protein N-acetyltransferase